MQGVTSTVMAALPNSYGVVNVLSAELIFSFHCCEYYCGTCIKRNLFWLASPFDVKQTFHSCFDRQRAFWNICLCNSFVSFGVVVPVLVAFRNFTPTPQRSKEIDLNSVFVHLFTASLFTCRRSQTPTHPFTDKTLWTDLHLVAVRICFSQH